jgi:mRNA-degrading endonuclease RelE of RelBE toxin-antitoxin system
MLLIDAVTTNVEKTMEVLLSRNAVNYLKRQGEPQKSRIKAALENLGNDPPQGDIIKLTGQDGYRARRRELRKSSQHSP